MIHTPSFFYKLSLCLSCISIHHYAAHCKNCCHGIVWSRQKRLHQAIQMVYIWRGIQRSCISGSFVDTTKHHRTVSLCNHQMQRSARMAIKKEKICQKYGRYCRPLLFGRSCNGTLPRRFTGRMGLWQKRSDPIRWRFCHPLWRGELQFVQLRKICPSRNNRSKCLQLFWDNVLIRANAPSYVFDHVKWKKANSIGLNEKFLAVQQVVHFNWKEILEKFPRGR